MWESREHDTHTHTHTYVHTYTHTHIYIHTYMDMYRRTGISLWETRTHTYTHTYIYMLKNWDAPRGDLMKRPTSIAKEAYIYSKRGLHIPKNWDY